MKRPLAAALAMLLAAVSSAAMAAIPINEAIAGPGDGSLSVRVVRDVNGNGNYDAALEMGVAGAAVTVTDPNGGTATGSTDAAGAVTVNLGGVTGGKYRVQVAAPAGSVLQPAPAGGGLSSLTEFVDVSAGKNVSITTGLWNPADYCQANPSLATACQKNRAGTVTASQRSLVTFPYSARGTAPAPSQVATQTATGTLYGLAYQKQTKRLFSGAFGKRHTSYGPGGTGAIYVTPTAGGATTQWATVPTAGSTAHGQDLDKDASFYDVPGKEALGDLELSEDGGTLYVVNMANRTLYAFDANAASGTAPKASYPIPDPGCAAAGDWRPMGLGVRDGVLHLGGVCSAESTNNRADLKAVVLPFSGTAFGAAVLTQPLTFQRGFAEHSPTNLDVSTHWNPWRPTYDPNTVSRNGPDGAHINRPTPLLSDIGFDADGSLILAFRDRFTDQMGWDGVDPRPGQSGLIEATSGGDLNRACRTAAGGYAWEGTGGCPNNQTAAISGGEPAGVVEYYPGEFIKVDQPTAEHQETGGGAVAFPLQQQRLASTAVDPIGNFDTAGIGFFDRQTGQMANPQRDNGYEIMNNQTEHFGKANGLGDLEALCDLAPVQIGNRVWFDTDVDGLQDGGEPALAGVKVTATPCTGGAALPVKTTNAKGEYYFGAADGLKPDTCYDLAFDYSGVNPATLPGAPQVGDLSWTKQAVGADRLIDSNVDAAGKTQVTVGKAGSVDHGLDAGIIAKITNKLGDFVWVDTNLNGVQDAGEPPVPGIAVVLKDGAGNPVGQPKVTDAQGKYLFDQLPDGTYQVCFDRSTLPAQYAGYGFTTKDAPSDDAKDSDADPATGCTATTVLGPNKREDLTLDAGLVPPNNKVGDFVWSDANRNGVQDAGEPGVPGVTVTLKDGVGSPVGQPKVTDAQGKYLFDQLPDGTYQVCFDLSTVPAQYAGYLLTKANVGDDGTDSDADPTTKCSHTTTLGPDKREDLTLDAGIRPPNKLGDFVWIDANKNGVQDGGEPPVPGVKVTVQDSSGVPVGLPVVTDAQGKYLFDKLPDGTYKVCFDIANLPAAVKDYQVATPNVGDDAKDSDADPATGCTPTTTLSIDKPEDLTLDLGLVVPVNRLGDYVWVDVNKDGLQDSSDVPVVGVTAKLMNAAGDVLATTKTDAQGKYLFDNLADGTYKVCFDIANLPAAVKDYKLTTANAGDDTKDSDADASGCTAPTTLGVGKRADLTLDAGLVSPPNKLGDFVWVDVNRDGVQGTDEPGVPGVSVTVKDEKGNPVGQPVVTDAQGKYLFDKLPDGTFTVCFDFAKMPAPYVGYLPTRVDAGGDDTKDSDADLKTGCTKPTSLGIRKREDLTLDAGIRPPNKLGDFVWIDANKNGVQDGGEPPVPGVKVTLSDGKTTTTDAQGKYEFPGLPDGSYSVCFDIKNLPATVADYQVATPNVGDDAKDSDADPATGCTSTTTLSIDKPEDLTLDLGLVVPVNRLGDYVWIDVNKDGLQDSSDVPVVGVTAKSLNAAGDVLATTKTDAQGKYLFSDLADGRYKVCFDIANLPDAVKDYKLTTANAGDDTKDSDADASGCTAPTALGVGKREDLTLDAGLVAPPNKLGDFVWIDTNKNGVQDDGEPGVPGVSVIVKDEKGTPVGKPVVTDAQGKYSFTDLPDGKYSVCFDIAKMPDAVKDYQATTPNVGDDAKDSDADPATGCTPVVELGVGKRDNPTLDLGIAPPVNRLGDTVWVDLDKDGSQDDGEPGVKDVKVTLKGTDYSTTTDGQGKYLFNGIPDGEYTVCFDVKDLPAAVKDYTLTKVNAGDDKKDSDADPKTGCTGPTSLGVGKREDLTLDAGLVAPPNTIGDLVWSDTNRDGVQDADEPGVPNVPVKLVDDKGKPVGEPVKTDEDGKYSFTDVPDGTYRVCFEMDALPGEYAGYQATKPNVGDDAKDSDADPATGCTPPVEVGVGRRENPTLDLGLVSPTNRLGDYVWEDTNGDGVQDPDEPGVADLPVYLQDGDGKPITSTTTGSDGKYLFTDLLDGSYQVCFGADPSTGLVRGQEFTKSDAGDDGNDSDVESASGCTHVTTLGPDRREDLSLDAGLRPRPPLASTGASVFGLLAAALLALAGGAVLLGVARRREDDTA